MIPLQLSCSSLWFFVCRVLPLRTSIVTSTDVLKNICEWGCGAGGEVGVYYFFFFFPFYSYYIIFLPSTWQYIIGLNRSIGLTCMPCQRINCVGWGGSDGVVMMVVEVAVMLKVVWLVVMVVVMTTVKRWSLDDVVWW